MPHGVSRAMPIICLDVRDRYSGVFQLEPQTNLWGLDNECHASSHPHYRYLFRFSGCFGMECVPVILLGAITAGPISMQDLPPFVGNSNLFRQTPCFMNCVPL